MDRYITHLSPVRPTKQLEKVDALSDALRLNSPMLCPQSPTKLGSPTKPIKPVLFQERLYQYEPALSPTKRREQESKKESEALKFNYHIETSLLRDDFYSTLLASCPVSDCLAVGLRHDVRLWSEQTGVKIPTLPTSWGIVSCLEFSSQGILAIGYSSGRVCLYDNEIDVMTTRVQLDPDNYPTCIRFKTDKVIYCGDNKGNLYVLPLVKAHGRERLKVKEKHSISTEIVSGLEFNRAGNRLVGGTNEGKVYIWDSGSPETHTLSFLHSFPHGAAVKAISFFPTVGNLFVTGGGRADRTLRVYDVNTFELMQKISVPAQVTGLIWLDNYELFAAMGHSKGGPIRIGQVYRFKSGECHHVYDVGDLPERSIYCCKTKTGMAVGLNSKKLLFYDWQKPQDVGNGKNLRKTSMHTPLR